MGVRWGGSRGPAPSRGQGGGGPRRLPQKQGPTGVGCHTPQEARTSWVLGNNSGRPDKTYNSVGELCARCQLRSPWGSLRASQANTEKTEDASLGRTWRSSRTQTWGGMASLSCLLSCRSTAPAAAEREGASADQAAEPTGSADKFSPIPAQSDKDHGTRGL